MATFNQEVTTIVALDVQDITTNTTTVGNIIDTQGNEAIDVVLFTGTATDGDYVLSLEHGDESNLSDTTVVAAKDLDALVSTVAMASADDDVSKNIGYVGKKQFIRPNIVSTNTSTGVTNFGGLVIFGRPRRV